MSNGELTGGRYAVARHVGELDDISHTIWGIIRHWLPASGEKMRKAPILFHYTNLAEGIIEQRLETDVYVSVDVSGESLPECELNHSLSV